MFFWKKEEREAEEALINTVGSAYLKMLVVALAVAFAALILALLPTTEADAAASLPSGFQEATVFSGLTNPMKVEFAPDGGSSSPRKAG